MCESERGAVGRLLVGDAVGAAKGAGREPLRDLDDADCSNMSGHLERVAKGQVASAGGGGAGGAARAGISLGSLG
jgi:hypothetical protein